MTALHVLSRDDIAARLSAGPEERAGFVREAAEAGSAEAQALFGQLLLGLINGATEERTATEWSKRLQVKTASQQYAVSTLSGGNQQKVVLAKWLATEPKLLIVDEPTRGIDVGTKSEVHRLLSDLAERGIAVLMISSELPEVLGMADRVLVMHEGRITAELPRSAATPETVMHAAAAAREVA